MKKKIIIELIFDETWDEYEDIDDNIILDDAIRDLAEGVSIQLLPK